MIQWSLDRTIMMVTNLEIQLERMDSKLEKHIGVTETILKNQEETLEKILTITKDHSNKFLSKDEAELMEIASNAKASEEVNDKLLGFENRLDKKYSKIIGAIVITSAMIFGLFEVIPMLERGSN